MKHLLFLLVLLLAPNIYAQSDDKIPEDRITVEDLKRKMDRKEDILIIDARAGSSYIGSTVKIKGAIHITLDQLESRIDELPKNKEAVIYCA